MTLIKKETPKGEINGVNKIFVFKNEIKNIDDLWLDWAIYTSFIIDWNKVILCDAPKSSIFADYYPKSNIIRPSTNRIFKEELDWIIDWNNKEFKTREKLIEMEDLWVDWAIYTYYTIDWNLITLEHAPTSSIYADYTTVGTTLSVPSDVTLWDIKTEVWRLLWQRPTSINFNKTVLGQKINSIIEQVWNWKIVNVLDPKEVIIASNMSFQEWSRNYKISNNASLAKRLKIGDTEAFLNANNFSYKGYVLIGSEIFEYAKRDYDWLKWIWVGDSEHYEGEKVEELYALPFDFWLISKLTKLAWDREVEIPFKEGNTSYEILNTKNWQNVLKINNLPADSEIKVYYIKKCPTLIEDTDFCPFPSYYWISVIATLTAWILAYESSLPMAESLLKIAYPNIREMYNYLWEQVRITKQKLRPNTYKFRGIRL